MKLCKRNFLYFLTVFILFLQVNRSLAQFNFGIKAGLNSNTFITGAQDFKSESTRFGLVGGAFFRFKRGVASLEPQLLFSQRNGEYSYSTLHLSYDSIFKSDLNYIDLPVLFGLHFGRILKIHTGPVFSVLVNENLVMEIKNQSVEVGLKDHAFKTINFGWQIGGNIEISSFILGILYERSMLDMTHSFKLPGTNTTFQPDARNNLWQITVGYKFLKR